MGFVVLALALPGMLRPIENFIEKGVSNMYQVAVPADIVRAKAKK
jgi:hypothetical protein